MYMNPLVLRGERATVFNTVVTDGIDHTTLAVMDCLANANQQYRFSMQGNVVNGTASFPYPDERYAPTHFAQIGVEIRAYVYPFGVYLTLTIAAHQRDIKRAGGGVNLWPDAGKLSNWGERRLDLLVHALNMGMTDCLPAVLSVEDNPAVLSVEANPAAFGRYYGAWYARENAVLFIGEGG